MQSQKSGEIKNKARQDFYKLYYPVKKSSVERIPSIRSKSMTSVLQSPDNQQSLDTSFVKPRKQIRKYNSINNPSSQKQKIMRKYRQKILKNSQSSDKATFKKVLSAQTPHQQLRFLIPKLPLQSIRDIEQFSSKNLSLKQSIDHFKDEKNKINTLLLSHKQSQQTKLTYLEVKKKELSHEIDKEIHEIYDRYFKKEYEAKYESKANAYAEFEKNIGELMKKMTQNIFG